MQIEILTSIWPQKSSKVLCTSKSEGGKKKTYWKPNTVESRCGLLIHVKVKIHEFILIELKKKNFYD